MKKFDANSQQPTANSQQPTANSQQPTANSQQPTPTADYLNARRAQLKQLFPEVFCEEEIDWEKLKLVLGAEALPPDRERYQLNWPGKGDAYRQLHSPPSSTLIPAVAESVDFERTQNLFIEAENLEALKILQKAYAGKVKMIYIDPPYNTGNDSFIYPDKFAESREDYAKRVGDRDSEGYLQRDGVFQGVWRRNSRDNGHYHSHWLSMMLPRLHLARTLLRDDGVIFISIDDNEQAQLKLLCDEVFGAENFVGQFPWRKRTAKSDVPFGVSTDYEYIFAYAKGSEFVASIEAEERQYFESEDFPGRPWRIHDLTKQTTASERPNSFFTLIDPKTGKAYPANPLRTWAISQETFQEYYDAGKIVFPNDYDFLKIKKPVMRYFKDDDIEKAGERFGRKAVSTKLPDEVGMSLNGTKEITELFNGKIFDFPKPLALLKFLLKTLHSREALIFDFFAGSGTTAHAVMQLNAEDGGNRRFICVQLPEEIDAKAEAAQAGFATIAEIAKERIRRAGRQIRENLPADTPLDTGFKVFKQGASAFNNGQPPAGVLRETPDLYVDTVKADSNRENLLYELMLRFGLPLTCPVNWDADREIYWVENEHSQRFAFLLSRATPEIIDHLCRQQPDKVVALDRHFSDELKINGALRFEEAGIGYEWL